MNETPEKPFVKNLTFQKVTCRTKHTVKSKVYLKHVVTFYFLLECGPEHMEGTVK